MDVIKFNLYGQYLSRWEIIWINDREMAIILDAKKTPTGSSVVAKKIDPSKQGFLYHLWLRIYVFFKYQIF